MYGFDSSSSQETKINSSSFLKLKERLRNNEKVASYYDDLSKEERLNDIYDDSLERKAERMRHCAELWTVDWHPHTGFKDLVDAGLCRDKFCVNCASALASAREHHFTPIFNEFAKDNSIYHAVFTVKNCSGAMLRSTIKTMFTSYSYLVRYLDGTIGRNLLKGYNLRSFGYNAAVRSLEVTYNKSENTYHPHLHCLMSMSHDLDLNKRFLNKFSYSRSHDDVRYFSSDEIFFQKAWYLLNNRIRVNAKNLEDLDLGYSVMLQKASPENYKEIFKYPFKEDLNKDNCLGYEQFKVYQKALKDLRVIQGYGDYLNFEFEDEGLSSAELDCAFREQKAELDKDDPPIRIMETVDEITDNIVNNRYVYQTAGSIKKHILEERLTEESKDVLKDFGNVVDKKG